MVLNKHHMEIHLALAHQLNRVQDLCPGFSYTLKKLSKKELIPARRVYSAKSYQTKTSMSVHLNKAWQVFGMTHLV